MVYLLSNIAVYWLFNAFLAIFELFVFSKQKTASGMRISDCSSDVCSSDLCQGYEPMRARRAAGGRRQASRPHRHEPHCYTGTEVGHNRALPWLSDGLAMPATRPSQACPDSRPRF